MESTNDGSRRGGVVAVVTNVYATDVSVGVSSVPLYRSWKLTSHAGIATFGAPATVSPRTKKGRWRYLRRTDIESARGTTNNVSG